MYLITMKPNDKYNRLTLIGDSGSRSKQGYVIWDCLCSCGRTAKVVSSYIRNGQTKSCGCLLSESSKRNITKAIEASRIARTKTGKSLTLLYKVWAQMLRRCNYPLHPAYRNYGGRGIKVWKGWYDFSRFEEWALSHGYAKGLTIDRIDNDKGYSPRNCQFITRSENAKKKRYTKKWTFTKREIFQ